MDVDGVMTDGRLFHFLDTRGRFVELKGVTSQDGIALTWLAANGIRTGVISGRASEGFRARARMLGMAYVVQGTTVKAPAFEAILRRARVAAEEAAYIGDDLTDIPPMRRAGLAVAVANARPEVKAVAHYVTRAEGGRGAVREVAERLLKAQGLWAKIKRGYEA